MMRRVAVLTALPALALVAASFAQPASARTGGLSVSRSSGHPLIRVAANQSGNWSGYNQGTLEQAGHKQFTAIAGDWTVPKASPHKANEAEYSSTWIGIGGGCIDAGCTATDNTLIQAGTEQDVDATGKATYSSWWEIIPEPSTPITTLTIRPGDHMHVTIAEATTGMWTITVADLTTKKSFKTTTPYSSSHLTAEWIVETPVVIGSGGSAGVAALPNLTRVFMDKSIVNGKAAQLKATEEVQLVANGTVLATPSAPDRDTDGFNDCVYATTCAAPASS
jgi:Peptidase A4 family